MITLPLNAVPSQTFSTSLNGQSTTINVYQKFYGLFMDVFLDNVLVIGGVPCLNLNLIVRSQYLGYSGDFAFYDTQGTSDPDYTGLGGRYQLIYYYPTDLAVGQY